MKDKPINIDVFKKNIRKYMKQVRSSIGQENLFFRSYAIYQSLIKLVDLKMIKTVSCYLDFDNEVTTFLFIMYCLENNIDVVVPKINNDKIVFKYIKKDMFEYLSENKYKILEPKDSAKNCKISDIDIFIVPALAFDESGCRLGYGKGFYDKVFKKNKNALRIGLSYSFQILPFLPSDKYDEFVDMVITEHNIVVPSNSFHDF